MNSRNALSKQLLALLGGVFDAKLNHSLVIFGEFVQSGQQRGR